MIVDPKFFVDLLVAVPLAVFGLKAWQDRRDPAGINRLDAQPACTMPTAVFVPRPPALIDGRALGWVPDPDLDLSARAACDQCGDPFYLDEMVPEHNRRTGIERLVCLNCAENETNENWRAS